MCKNNFFLNRKKGSISGVANLDDISEGLCGLNALLDEAGVCQGSLNKFNQFFFNLSNHLLIFSTLVQ